MENLDKILIALVVLSIILVKGTAIFNYLRPTWEGHDGKASFKRLTVLLSVILFTWAFFGDFYYDYFVSDTILEILATIVIVGVLGNSAQSVATAFVNRKKPIEPIIPDFEDTTSTQEEGYKIPYKP